VGGEAEASSFLRMLPDSKTPEGRRTFPMSERVFEILRRRSRDSQGVEKKEGWVFPACRKNAKLPYLTSIAKHFAEAREKGGLPKNLVLYCGRHDFGTVITARTGNSQSCDESDGTPGCEDRHALPTS
jgi:integrase